MSEADITLWVTRSETGQRWRLYYYQGNFYYPVMLAGKQLREVKTRIKSWCKVNLARIEKDRNHPNYRTKLQLFDDSFSQLPPINPQDL